MKNTAFLLLLALLSCNNSPKNVTFDSSELKGKYDIDIKPFISETVDEAQADNAWELLGQGLAVLALASVELELGFYENNHAVMTVQGGLMDMAHVFGDSLETEYTFKYLVKEDSVVYIKEEEAAEYEKWAVIREFSNDYNRVRLLVVEEGGEKFYLNLLRKSQK